MKNTKAIFLIILGSFILATGFAFAENVALSQAERWLDKSGNSDLVVASGGQPAPAAPAATTTPAAAPTPAAVVPAPAPAPAPAPKPTFGENMKKFLGKHMATMTMMAIGAFVGSALLGPVGIIAGAMFMFTLMYLSSL